MYRTAISEIRVGAPLGAGIFDQAGRPLLRAGVDLSEPRLELIRAHDYTRLVLLEPGESASPEFIAPRTRVAVLEALRPAIDYLRDGWRRKLPFLRDDARALDLRLGRACDELVRQTIAQPTLTLPGPSRLGAAQWFDDALQGAAVAVHLAHGFGIDAAALAGLAGGMLLRDAAMLDLPPEIHTASSDLSDAALDALRTHPVRTYDALTQLDWLDEPARLVVLQHHERQDGTGYPYGLADPGGDPSPERPDRSRVLPLAEIAAVADVFVALTGDRVHRPAYPLTSVRRLFADMAGLTLQAEVVDKLFARWQPPREAIAEEQRAA